MVLETVHKRYLVQTRRPFQEPVMASSQGGCAKNDTNIPEFLKNDVFAPTLTWMGR